MKPGHPDTHVAFPGGGLTVTDHAFHDHNAATELQRRGDRNIYLGAALMGTMILSIVGLPTFLHGLRQLTNAERRGLPVRPRTVTVIASLIMVASLTSMWQISLDLFANHALMTRVSAMGYGLLFDGAYAWHYNGLAIGGAAGINEKPYQVLCLFVLYPALMASAVGLMKMTRWGYQNSIIFAFGNIFAIVGYTVNLSVYHGMRISATEFGVPGWWIYNSVRLVVPLVVLALLFTLDKETFTTKPRPCA
jgi:hypothetical protein